MSNGRDDDVYRVMQTKLRQTELLIDSAHYFASSLEFSEVMTRVLERVLHVIEAANAGVLFIYEASTEVLNPVACSGFDWEQIQHVRLVSGESMTGLTFQLREPHIFRDPNEVVAASMSAPNRAFYEQSLAPLMRSAGQQFAVQSVMCAQLVIKDRCIGVMTLDNFSEDQFTEDDLSLLLSLSNQAVVALENARLYEEEMSRRDKLEQLNAVIQLQNQQLHKINQAHQRLMRLLLGGGTVVDMAGAVYDILEKPITVYDDSFRIIGQQGFSQADSGLDSRSNSALDSVTVMGLNRVLKDGKHHWLETKGKNSGDRPATVLFPILTSNKVVGILAVQEDQNRLTEQEIVLVEQCTLVLALELMKLEQVYEIEQRFKGEFLDELLSDQNVGLLKERAKALGLSPDHSFTFLVTAFDQSGVKEASARRMWSLERKLEQEVLVRNPQSLVITKFNSLVAILSWPKKMTTDKVLERSRKLAEVILDAAHSADAELNLTIGIGRVCKSFREFVDSYEDAKQCIAFAKTRNLKNTVKDYIELGAVRFLLDQPKDKLIQYVNDLLKPIFDSPAEKSTNLLRALDAFIVTGKRLKEAAGMLDIHPNTLAYRLKVLETTLGYRIDDYPAFFNLQFAWSVVETYDLKDKLLQSGEPIRSH